MSARQMQINAIVAVALFQPKAPRRSRRRYPSDTQLFCLCMFVQTFSCGVHALFNLFRDALAKEYNCSCILARWSGMCHSMHHTAFSALAPLAHTAAAQRGAD
eukprot:RCo024098